VSLPLPWPRLLRLLVWLIAAHSFVIGLVLLFASGWGLRLGGWTELPPTFFPMQGGAFHLVVAFGYVLEYERHRTVSLLLFAKLVGTVFLVTVWLASGRTLPWAVPMSAVGDGAMGVAVLWVWGKVARGGRDREPGA
jgi:hypothetical protein